MKAKEICKILDLECVTGESGLGNEVTSGYVCDLLSWIMGNIKSYSVLVTIQGHVNIIAVGILTGISAVIITEGSKPDEDTIKRAADEGIPIFLSSKTSYETVIELYKIGIR